MRSTRPQRKSDDELTVLIVDENQLISALAAKEKFFNQCQRPDFNEKYEIKATTSVDREAIKNFSLIKMDYSIFDKETNAEISNLYIGVAASVELYVLSLRDKKNKSFNVYLRGAFFPYIEGTDQIEQYYSASSVVNMQNFDDLKPILDKVHKVCTQPIQYTDANNEKVKTACNTPEDLFDIFNAKTIFNWQKDFNKLKVVSIDSIFNEKSHSIKFKKQQMAEDNYRPSPNQVTLSSVPGEGSLTVISDESKDGLLSAFKNFINNILGGNNQTIEVMEEDNNEQQKDNTNEEIPEKLIFAFEETDSNDSNNCDEVSHILKKNPIDSNNCRECDSFMRCSLIQLLCEIGCSHKLSQSLVSNLMDITKEEKSHGLLNFSLSPDSKAIVLSFPNLNNYKENEKKVDENDEKQQ
jgi:hypothetical protein